MKQANMNKQTAPGRALTASQHRDLVEAITIVKNAAKPAPRVLIDQLPGLSPGQLRGQIDRISDVQNEMAVIAKQYEDALAKLKNLEKEEKDGIAKLKEAASHVSDKDRYLVETKKAILEFTAYVQSKPPGSVAMISKPGDPGLKPDEKAGDLLARIAEKLGEDVAKQVGVIYLECQKDITHMADCISGLKVIAKTAGIRPSVVKAAGLDDVIVNLKDWLVGGVSSVVARILNFAGDIDKWLKGFEERTKIVGKASESLQDSLAVAEKQFDKILD